MERVKGYTISKAELDAAKAGTGVHTLDIPIPPGTKRWSLYMTPVDAGGGNAPSARILYYVRGVARVVNPGTTSATLNLNEASISTREDVIAKIQLEITPNATDPQPSGGVEVDLFVVR